MVAKGPYRLAMDPVNPLLLSSKLPKFRVELSSRLSRRLTSHYRVVTSRSPNPLPLLRGLQSKPASQLRLLNLPNPISLLRGNKLHRLQKRRARGRVDCPKSAVLYNILSPCKVPLPNENLVGDWELEFISRGFILLHLSLR